ncbi:MAG: membrane protein insertase YidC [Lentisphaeria bacterium]|nr:membrane protein insertase YidC [Lentisphaeria bacterium]
MKFDKETIIGIGICLVLLLAWPAISKSLGWAPEEATEQTTAVAEKATGQSAAATEETAAAAKTETTAAAPSVQPAAPQIPETAQLSGCENVVFGNDSISLTVSGENGAICSIGFRKYLHDDRENLITLDNTGLFTLYIPGFTTGKVEINKKSDSEVTSIVELLQGNAKLLLTRTYTVSEDYTVSCRITLTNTGIQPVTVRDAVVSGVSLAPWHLISGDELRRIAYRLDYITADGDHEDIDGDENDEDYYPETPIHVRWCSVSNRYFCSILKPAETTPFQLWLENPRREIADAKGKKHYMLTAGAQLQELKLLPGESETLEYSSYTGPKSSGALAAFADGGEEVMHLAWGPVDLLARFLMWVLNLLYSLCHSYGLSIIILTLLVRTAFYPLTSKGNESMRKMQKVQPKFKELKEKYKDNPQLLNQKMTELYRQEGINPLAGCLPILLQIPIFFALYAMLDNAIALRHVSFLWAKNLAAADTVFSIPLGFTLPILGLNAIPVNPLVLAMTALMVVQQRMTPMSMDPAQKKMMMMMPVIMLLFLYPLPSGLTLYWTVSNIFSIIQLWLQQKRNRKLQDAAEGQGR